MSLIECNLTVLGLTGVEDKLQDNVKVTLENLKNGGMKIWMLTGDKIETAISIAISSKIFDRNTDYKIISNTTDLETIKTFFNEIKRFNMDALVVDGVSLSTIMEECFDEFIDLSMELKGVIGCRFSPTQKALVARALRLRSKKIVCCIGDGGNDVSMITEANLGIGIVGKEGNQASLAADYSIEKFCYVTELFYWHGRNSYKNSATIANLIIHRGIILSVLQGLFCALINFIPFNLYVGIIMIAFVSIYTFFPIFSSVFTTDVSREVTQMFPELYKEPVEQTLLSIKEFTSWNLMSFIQGTIIMFAMVWYFDKELLV
ncbi:phospholipid-transporting atpase [Vairimorpha apis BRL 01]|uniref:P-type phospholipid transporter n=1 Tax=Vairimorpha apis BRL 01 TaxID=1037528 RepID=T0LA07_9MICR|nr:phospholipid-transporting atpase [Vairimorpha apis BRL 01]